MTPLNERRGLNRQQAIEYLGIKGDYFDNEIRHKLHSMKKGTSVIFDKLELDTVFDEIMLVGGDVGPTVKGAAQWPKDPRESLKQRMDAGGSTRPIKELDFRDVLKRIKQQKTGC